MRFRVFAIVSLFVSAVVAAFGQCTPPAPGYVEVCASALTDSSGNLISNATVSWQPTDNNGNRIGYKVGGHGQAISWPSTAQVTSGAFQIKVADTFSTSPQNICYAVTITDNSTGNVQLSSGYNCVQPAGPFVFIGTIPAWCTGSSSSGQGGTCNFDLYPPNFTTGVIVQTGPTGPVGVMNSRGAWAASTSYAVNDTFAEAGSAYVVTSPYTSGSSFGSTDTTHAQIVGAYPGVAADGSNGVVIAGNAKAATVAASVNGVVNPMAAPYNCYGDGIHDDTTCMQTASAAGPLFIAPGRIFLVNAGTIDVAGIGSTRRNYQTLTGSGTISCQPSTTQVACVRVQNGSVTTLDGPTVKCNSNVTYCVEVTLGAGVSTETTTIKLASVVGGQYPLGIGPDVSGDVSHVEIWGTYFGGGTTVPVSAADIVIGNGTQGNVLDNSCHGCTIDLGLVGVLWRGGGFDVTDSSHFDQNTVDLELSAVPDNPVVVDTSRSEGSTQFLKEDYSNITSAIGLVSIKSVKWTCGASPATYTIQHHNSSSISIVDSFFACPSNTVTFDLGSGTGSVYMNNVGVSNPTSSWTAQLATWTNTYGPLGAGFYSTNDYYLDGTTFAKSNGSGWTFSSSAPYFSGNTVTQYSSTGTYALTWNTPRVLSIAGVTLTLPAYATIPANVGYTFKICNTSSSGVVTISAALTGGYSGSNLVQPLSCLSVAQPVIGIWEVLENAPMINASGQWPLLSLASGTPGAGSYPDGAAGVWTALPVTKSGTPAVGAGVCWKTSTQLGTCTAGTWPSCSTCN